MQLIPDIDTLTVWFCKGRTLERGNSENNDQAAHSAVEIQVSGGPITVYINTYHAMDRFNKRQIDDSQKIESDTSCKLSLNIFSEN